MRPLKPGDLVRVRLAGTNSDWTPAFVGLCSDGDPASVALMLDGPVAAGGGALIFKMLPLTVDYRAEIVFSIFGDAYEIELFVRETEAVA